ncbi:uncharacterized protein LOC110692213 [Chenopodium quinoa]|uniref:uncharacterized protein LOC110692213 n=1 Tax=Chenopodium quinoa TaxID=63459 RepID=UPI000B78A899|nr:uncharacterized protein LOC110692213 [Chenopodium quinoa]
MGCSFRTHCQNSDDDFGIASPENDRAASQCSSPRLTENIERNMGESSNNVGEVSSNEGMQKMVEKCSLPLHSRRASSSACTYTLDIPTKTTMRVESFKSPKHHERVLTNEGTTCSLGDESTPRTFLPSPGMYLCFMLSKFLI